MTKKIVFKVPEFPHLSETFIVAQIITAIKLGYEVKILIRKFLDNDTAINSILIKEYDLLDKIIIEDYNIPKNRLIRLIKWIVLLILNFQDLSSIIKYHKEFPKFSLTWLYQWFFFQKFSDMDIFHVQYGTNSKPLDILKKTGFKPALIVTFHGHDAFFPINGYILNNGYYDNLFKHADLITANTPYLANKIIELGCPKELLSIIPVGVDTDFFYPNTEHKTSQNTLKLITVGRLDKVKGHDFCIMAMTDLINKGFDITLTIIGEGEERTSLENLIAKYQLEGKVYMKGKKSQLEVRQELWEHDVYLLTAVALKDGRRETQGLATLEAQACGLPVVAFDSGGVKYTIKEKKTGLICKEYDVQEVSEKIKLLYSNPILRIEMGINTKDFIKQHFSQNHIDSIWEKEYLQLLRA
ncbi:glycosyltransferase [Flavobacterium sp. MDT1-60]|uniref:glycosyltransferase n=1 Tax=Flavobacterium sp. MDT1-60 TaxID=1979344 RepID=UPI0017869641|nr:glycosyltransferase [Flavobacterium sp. MDT1-60]QOG03810.1 glycosyltransferase [Flavobacterium sp. MDT1-60]